MDWDRIAEAVEAEQAEYKAQARKRAGQVVTFVLASVGMAFSAVAIVLSLMVLA